MNKFNFKCTVEQIMNEVHNKQNIDNEKTTKDELKDRRKPLYTGFKDND